MIIQYFKRNQHYLLLYLYVSDHLFEVWKTIIVKNIFNMRLSQNFVCQGQNILKICKLNDSMTGGKPKHSTSSGSM